ncbi:MAG: DUF2178 domain-containing protein [Patescibacteria group bacterium]|nr:DUF2178 domain-containing protein [Patescibacteria group bacterium]
MSKKKYQLVKLSLMILLAIIFSQAIIFKNYLISISLLIVSSLILLYLRRQVKEIIADERDYAIGGKAALLSIQIYSWIAVISMLLVYGLRDLNPAYEPIGLTLAFSTCLLMLLYGVVFRYYDKVKLTGKKSLYAVFVFLLFLIIAIATLRLFSGEDNWVCENGKWTPHGHPSFLAPTVNCK